ncbi:MAG: LuxR C-terminal-related transcriptional regulator, partial [Thermoanaerobaculia bacterium]
DVLVVDLRMPVRGGLAVMRELAREESAVKVVVLTAALDEDEVLEAIRLGARGVVLKEMAPRLLIQCVRAVAAGAKWLDRELLGKALDKAPKRPLLTADSLTPRELDVVRLVSRGLRNKEIAEQLDISAGTVKIHLHSIYEKLQIGGRVELSLLAREQGIV